MGDRKAGAEAAKKLLTEDAGLRKKLLAYAYKLTRNTADARDLSQAAMARAIDPEASPWDEDAQPSLFLHLGSVMNTLVANRRRGDDRHPARVYDPAKDLRHDPEPSPLERLISAEEVALYRRWMDLLLGRLAGDDVALGRIRLMYEAVDEPTEQARRLGCTAKEIYLAIKRITYQVEIVKRDAPDGRPPASPVRALDRTPDGGTEVEP